MSPPDVSLEATALFAPVIGEIIIRRMFGGAGIYAGELMIAVEMNGDIGLRVDGEGKAKLAAAGARPLSYMAKGREIIIDTYWTIPEDVRADRPTLQHLVERARVLAATAKSKAKKKARKAAG